MNDYSWIFEMTNKEAAAIIKNAVLNAKVARSNGKSVTQTALTVAFMKAVALLENTPD